MKKFHQYHMVEMSPWPIMASTSAMSNVMSMTMMFSFKSMLPSTSALISLSMTSIQWWRDVLREASLMGNHPNKVTEGIKMGMLLFIASEVMFFSSFFWAFFHCSLAASKHIGSLFPPEGIETFNPASMPLLNTMLLLSSGFSITWSHHSILKNKMKESKKALIMTILLGVYFIILQATEYSTANFSMFDSIFGCTFFMATGFHGLHVMLGDVFLITMALQMNNMKSSSKHFIGFEMAAWYWHFVDVVWLFLYTMFYWWGS